MSRIINVLRNIVGQLLVRAVSPIANPRYAVVFDEGTTNLIPNPSFEVNTTGWSALGANASISRVTTQKSSGDASLQVVVSPAAAGQGATTAALAVTAGLSYVFAVDVRGNAGGEAVSLKADFDSGTDVTGGAYTLSTSFNRLRLSFTAPVGATTVQLQIITSGAVAITWFADAAQLEQRASMTSYCDGSMGQGYTWTGTAHNSTSVRVAGFRVLAPLNAGATSRWGIKPDGTISVSKMVFSADELVGTPFTDEIPFEFIGNQGGLTLFGTQGAILKARNLGNGPALWVESAASTDVAMVLEVPSLTSGMGLGIAAPSDLTAFTGEYISFVTKAGLRQFQFSKLRQQIGGANDALQKSIQAYGGGKYTTALQANFTGTVSVAAASPTVTGVGTTFLTQYKIGDTIAIQTGGPVVYRRVIAIASNTSLTANANYVGVLSGVTHTQPVLQYSPFGHMFESAGGDHANLAQADFQNFVWFNRGDRPKMLRGSAVNTTVFPTSDSDGLYFTHELARTSTQVVIASTAAETTAFTATVPAGRLALRGSLRLMIMGRFLFNNAAANTLQLRVKYGGTTMVDSTALQVPGGVSATRRAFMLEAYLMNVNSEISQKMFARLQGTTQDTFDGSDVIHWHSYGTAAENSDIDRDLVVTAQWGTAAATNSFEVEFATLEAV